MLYTDSHSHSQKKKTSFTTVSSTMSTQFLIFRIWVPDLHPNKSLEHMSEIPCKYFTQNLLSTLYILSIYSSYTFQNTTYLQQNS